MEDARGGAGAASVPGFVGEVILEERDAVRPRQRVQAGARFGRRHGGHVEAEAVASYPWGSTAAAQDTFCGKSEPKRIWWKKAKTCTLSPGCVGWELRYEGFADYSEITIKVSDEAASMNDDALRGKMRGIGESVRSGTVGILHDGADDKLPLVEFENPERNVIAHYDSPERNADLIMD